MLGETVTNHEFSPHERKLARQASAFAVVTFDIDLATPGNMIRLGLSSHVSNLEQFREVSTALSRDSYVTNSNQRGIQRGYERLRTGILHEIPLFLRNRKVRHPQLMAHAELFYQDPSGRFLVSTLAGDMRTSLYTASAEEERANVATGFGLLLEQNAEVLKTVEKNGKKIPIDINSPEFQGMANLIEQVSEEIAPGNAQMIQNVKELFIRCNGNIDLFMFKLSLAQQAGSAFEDFKSDILKGLSIAVTQYNSAVNFYLQRGRQDA